MNSKIREFEHLSGIDVYGLGHDRDKWVAALEKYTRMVVTECTDVVDEWAGDNPIMHGMAMDMNHKFGLDGEEI